MHRRVGEVVVGLVEPNEVEAVLQPAKTQPEEVAPKHALQGDQGGVVQKYLSDAAVAGPQGLEHPDHVGALQYQHQERGDHVDDGHGQHEREDDHLVVVLQAQPFKNSRKFFPDGYAQQVGGQHLVVDKPAEHVQVADVVEPDFKAGHFIGLPAEQFLHHADVAQSDFAVILLQAGFVDATHLKAAAQLLLFFDEVYHELVAHVHLKSVGGLSADEDVSRGFCAVQLHKPASLQVRLQVFLVEIGPDAFEQNAFHGRGRADDAGFVRVHLDVPHAAERALGDDASGGPVAVVLPFVKRHLIKRIQIGVKILVALDGRGLKRQRVGCVRYVYMPPKLKNLLADFPFKPRNEPRRRDHDRHAQRHCYGSNADDHAGKTLAFGKSDALGNEKRKIHSCERVGVWGVNRGKDTLNDAKRVYPYVAVRGIGLEEWGWGG